MRILVIGANGFLGEKLMSRLSGEFEVFGTCKSGECADLLPLDVTDSTAVTKTLAKVSPDVVIDTCGITNVDYCEEHPEEARKVNVDGVQNLVNAKPRRIIYISTDFVFDGERGGYTEDDEPRPISEYGKMKLEAERVVQGSGVDHLIARVSVLYGYNTPKDKTTFVGWVLNNLRNKKNINVVDDQYNSPTLIDDIAEGLSVLIKKNASGVHHLTGNECIDRHAFSTKIAEVFGLDKSLIASIPSTQLPQKAKRPKNACLKSVKRDGYGIRMSDAVEGLSKMKKQMEQG